MSDVGGGSKSKYGPELKRENESELEDTENKKQDDHVVAAEVSVIIIRTTEEHSRRRRKPIQEGNYIHEPLIRADRGQAKARLIVQPKRKNTANSFIHTVNTEREGDRSKPKCWLNAASCLHRSPQLRNSSNSMLTDMFEDLAGAVHEAGVLWRLAGDVLHQLDSHLH